jgi:hypothetical protein
MYRKAEDIRLNIRTITGLEHDRNPFYQEAARADEQTGSKKNFSGMNKYFLHNAAYHDRIRIDLSISQDKDARKN